MQSASTSAPSSDPAATPENPTPAVDPAAVAAFVAEQRTRQSLPLGLLAGFLAALVGAAVWAGVTVGTGYQIGWMAVGVGFLVGVAVRAAGKGIDPAFGFLGAVLALLGCLLGNVFSAVGFAAQQESVSFFEVLGFLNLTNTVELLVLTFSPIDLLFYGIAVYEGYRFSFTPIAVETIADPAQ